MGLSWPLRIRVGSSVIAHVPLWRGCSHWGRLCMGWGCVDGKSVCISLSLALNCSKNMKIFCKMSWTPRVCSVGCGRTMKLTCPWAAARPRAPSAKRPYLGSLSSQCPIIASSAFLLSPQAIWIPIRDLFVIHSLLFLFWSMPNFLSWLTLSQQPKH